MIGFIIPAFNEETTIQSVTRSVGGFGQVVVVDDASTDNTAQLAESAGATVARLPYNQGYNSALEAGFRVASEKKFDYVITVDADGQHQIEDVKSIIEGLKAGYDLVLGQRQAYARFTEWFFGLVTRLKWGITDPLCGLKGYNIELYKAVGFFDSKGSTGTELMIRSLNRGCRYHQAQIITKSRCNEASRFGSTLKANLKIIKSLIRVLPLILLGKHFTSQC